MHTYTFITFLVTIFFIVVVGATDVSYCGCKALFLQKKIKKQVLIFKEK